VRLEPNESASTILLGGVGAGQFCAGLGRPAGHQQDLVRDTSWKPLFAGLVERNIQFQHVDAGLAEKAQLPLLYMAFDQRTDAVFAKAAYAGNARHLEECGSGSDVRVEARA
jgi:hypothetical protein